MRLRIVLCLMLSLWSAAAYAAKVQEVTTDNGITAWLIEEHSLPLVAVKMVFKQSGFAYDPPGKGGRANMTAALLSEGAGALNARQFNEALENRAIRLGFSADEDYFNVALEHVSTENDAAFSYLGMALTQPRFDADAIERIRRQSLSVLVQQQQQPAYKLQRAWQKAVFGTHPYANGSLGDEQTIASLQSEDFRQFAQSYLARDRLVIAVVGDITPEALKQLLTTHLGGLPAHAAPDVTVTDVAFPEKGNTVLVEQDIPQTLIGFALPGLKRNDPDFYAAYVMNTLLGGNPLNDRLSLALRQQRGLTYSVSSHLDPMTHAASWRGQFATRHAQAATARDVLKDTIKRFAEQGPSGDELRNAKRYLTGSFVLNLDSNADVATFLLTMQLHQLGKDYLQTRNALMNAITKEQIMRVAHAILHEDRLMVVMVGKP